MEKNLPEGLYNKERNLVFTVATVKMRKLAHPARFI